MSAQAKLKPTELFVVPDETELRADLKQAIALPHLR